MERYIPRRDEGTVDEVKHIKEDDHGGCNNDCELDLLFLVHSDISSLLHQIDELVVKAAKVRTSREGTREVESFTSVLSDMLSSLKPWFPRLQEAISHNHPLPKDQGEQSLDAHEEEELVDVESPEPTQFESLVSPSPLVAWRGDNNVEKGRQLFMLTPLPLGKSEFLKHRNASKLTSKKIFPSAATNQLRQALKEPTDSILGCEAMKSAVSGNSLGHVMDEPMSTPVVRRKIESEVLLTTPCLKMSPPKSCTLFKLIPETSQLGKQEACKSTYSELGASTLNGSQSSGSSSNDITEDLCLKYPELLGLQHAPITRKTDVESSPVWWFSPPKTCVLLEPANEKKLMGETCGSSFTNPNIINPEEGKQTKEGSMSLVEGSMSVVVESTPLLKEADSIMAKNRTRAGESTLKKELWTRFEEASLHGNRFSSMTTVKGNKKKGFMEMLEEACGNEETQDF